MSPETKSLIIFMVSSFLLAVLVDYLFYSTGMMSDVTRVFLWGFLRMYTPTVAVIISGDLRNLRSYINPQMRVLTFYLISPFIVFGALLTYFLIITPLGFLTFEPFTTPAFQQTDPVQIIIFLLVGSYFTSITLNAVFALGEEIGWRGFLQGRFEALGIGFVKSTLLVGLIWGLWHTSAIILLGHNYPENRLLGALLFPIFTLAVSLPHSLMRRISKSVLPAASLHGAINATWGVTILTTTLPREVAGLGPLAYASWTVISILMYLLVMGRELYKHHLGLSLRGG